MMTHRVEHDLWQEEEDLEVIITHDHPVELDQTATVIHANEDGLTIEFHLNGDMTGSIALNYHEWFDLSQRLATTKEES